MNLLKDKRVDSKLETATMMMNRLVEGVSAVAMNGVEMASETSLGQTAIKLVDRLLWVVEKTSQWSLPQKQPETEENGKSFGKVEVSRPLPWILFLPGLIAFRTIKMCLNIGCFMLGYPEIQPSSIVKYVQKGRKKLRTIRSNGMKNRRQRKQSVTKDRGLPGNSTKRSLIRSITLTLSTLSCLDASRSSPSPPPTKIHVKNQFEMATGGEKSATESNASPQHNDKRKHAEMSSDERATESEDETLTSKINRLASEDSLNDEDFNPDNCSISSTSSDQTDSQVSETEIQDLQNDLNRNNSTTFTTNNRGRKSLGNDVASKKTDEESGKGSMTSVNSEGYHSPNSKNSQDGDAALYYSPVSSKSTSPERLIADGSEQDGKNNKTVGPLMIKPIDQKTVDGNEPLKNNTGVTAKEQSSSNGQLLHDNKPNPPAPVYGKGNLKNQHKRSSHLARKKK